MKNLATIFFVLLLVVSACHNVKHQQESKGNAIKETNGNYTFAAPLSSQKPSGQYQHNAESMDMPHPGDRYAETTENAFMNVEKDPISTFSIDADGAAYANMRRFLQDDKRIPPADAIRTEEMLNYFDMGYGFDGGDEAIALNGEVSDCPWEKSHKLVRIGIQGKPLDKDNIPPSNYVFLIDVSGSMSTEDKLELLKGGFIDFVDQMSEEDRIAIVTYAGSAGVILQSTSGQDKAKIKRAIKSLGSGGSTAGAQGIITAYEIAEANFIRGGNNRIILGTDGDFNVGPSDTESLIEMIEEKRESGMFLTVLGVGRGNLNDAMLEQLANKGNGTYEYIDCINQLRKVFIQDASKFFAVAKDVKVQIKFAPESVESYRLIGYENRVLATEDFTDDTRDAGEIGAGQGITALYEIVPVKREFKRDPVLSVDFRYKAPDSKTSKPLSLVIMDEGNSFARSSEQMRVAASVAAFSLILRDSEYKGEMNLEDVLRWSKGAISFDPYGFKTEFRSLVKTASGI